MYILGGTKLDYLGGRLKARWMEGWWGPALGSLLVFLAVVTIKTPWLWPPGGQV